MSEELELKLALSPKDLGRLRRNPLVRSLASRRSTSKRLYSTYYDTPSQALRRKGMALRVRRVGKRLVQTLKVPVNGQSGLQHYQEFEAPVSAEKPELDRVADDSLRRLFSEENLAEQLQPVFTTEFNRSYVPLKMDESEFELALDQGEISAGDARMPICEAEVELISGRPDRIYEFALALHRRVKFRLEARTKAARGYGLAEKTNPAAVRAEPLRLRPKMSVEDAFLAAARNCLKQIRANEPVALIGADPEGVHQFRVGVRRLRALMSAFKPLLPVMTGNYLSEELSWLQSQTGPARDWDVFAKETLKPLRDRLPQVPNLGAMTDQAEAARADAYRQVAGLLASQRYTELLLRLELWLESAGWAAGLSKGAARELKQPIRPFAARVLKKRSRKLYRAGHKSHELSEAELHKVRILAKKLRYPTEFFRELYPGKAVRRHLLAITAIQDALGSLNDAVVGESLLAELESRMPGVEGKDPCQTEVALGVVRGWQAACIERDLAGFAEAWSKLEEIRPYWS